MGKNFKEEDIQVLDKLLKLVVAMKQQVTSVDYARKFSLPHDTPKFEKERESELERYSIILESYEAVKIERLQYGFYLFKNDNSEFIIENGGFQTIFEENQKIQTNRNNEIKLVEKRLKQININSCLALLSVIISILSLFKKQIFNYFNLIP